MMMSFVLSFFPRDVLDEILNLIESVSEDFPSYSFVVLLFKLIHIMFQRNRHRSSKEEDFFTIWRPSWSCDMDQMYELSFSL